MSQRVLPLPGPEVNRKINIRPWQQANRLSHLGFVYMRVEPTSRASRPSPEITPRCA